LDFQKNEKPESDHAGEEARVGKEDYLKVQRYFQGVW